MKKILGTLVTFFLLMTVGAGIWIVLFRSFLQGGAEQEYLYPIYGGIVLLSGLIAGCTVIIIEELKEVKTMLLEKGGQVNDINNNIQ
ncbi:hypothetical protein [Tissierella creatinophila]|uniref:Uncharacterized protein n=1 Tax=Tissierella creatinophila DSM 6911 TaxID=1123403 RepID=A0A1U7M6V6_TISCR|nr:hypothetical protein [Tissierella creatinophila]OLS03037.1 hypothetical protein TICRE_07330 [Tissierella creatinophila DSM 6911]